MLYIASSGLGENIFATHSIEFLSSLYEIHFVVQKSRAIFFKNYRFITKLIEVSDSFLVRSSESHRSSELLQVLQPNDYKEYYSHNSYALDSFRFLGIPAREHAREHVLKLSCPEQYLIRAGGDPGVVDIRYKPVCAVKKDNVAKIVLYTGSRENIRKLPLSTYSNLLEKLSSVYASRYKLYCVHSGEHPNTQTGFSYIQDSPENAEKIISLFSSGVNLMIGPDSGLTHVALSFDIPQVWMETRDREEMAIPSVYKEIVEVFRVNSPVCNLDCRARTHIRKYGVNRLDHCPTVAGFTRYQNLLCQKFDVSPCLTFSEEDYSILFNKINNLLQLQS